MSVSVSLKTFGIPFCHFIFNLIGYMHVQTLKRKLRVLNFFFSRGKVIETKWEGLLSKLESCRSVLSHYHDLMSVFAEMNDCLADMTQIEVR